MIQQLLLLALPAAFCVGGPAAASDAHLPPAAPVAGASVRAAPSLAEVYRAAQSWESFYERADARREIWVRNWTTAAVPAELAERARAAGGSWRILAITESGCSDSVNTIPYIARLVEQTPGLELRIADSAAGRPWMEAHRSPDGRASTPTVLVLDEEYRIRGCWIEQPVALQGFWLPVVARGTMSQEVGQKMAWYEEEGGRETLREFVEVLEGAHRGEPVCPGLE